MFERVIRELNNFLAGKKNRTDTVNAKMDQICQDIADLYRDILGLYKTKKIYKSPARVKQILFQTYLNLKNLDHIDEFVEILHWVEEILIDFKETVLENDNLLSQLLQSQLKETLKSENIVALEDPVVKFLKKLEENHSVPNRLEFENQYNHCVDEFTTKFADDLRTEPLELKVFETSSRWILPISELPPQRDLRGLRRKFEEKSWIWNPTVECFISKDNSPKHLQQAVSCLRWGRYTFLQATGTVTMSPQRPKEMDETIFEILLCPMNEQIRSVYVNALAGNHKAKLDFASFLLTNDEIGYAEHWLEGLEEDDEVKRLKSFLQYSKQGPKVSK